MSLTEAKIYKGFFFEDNNSIFLFLGIEALGKLLDTVKLVNSDVIHYIVKLLKVVNLLVFNIISFFLFGVIKDFCSIIELMFFKKD